MSWVIEFDICALIIFSLLLWIVFRRTKFPSLTNTTYRLLLFLGWIASFFDIISIFAIENATTIPLWMNYIIQLCYMIPFFSLAMVFYIYVLSLTIYNRKITRVHILFITIPFLAELLLVFTSPLTHWVFYFDSNFNYCHGWGNYYTYATAFYYIVLSLLDLFRQRKIIPVTHVSSVFLYAFSCGLSVLLQYLFDKLLLINFAVSIASMTAAFSLQNPQDLLDKSSGAFNLKAFKQMLLTLFHRKKSFTVFCLETVNYQYMNQTLGFAAIDELAAFVVQSLYRLVPQKQIYHLSHYFFGIILDNDFNLDELTNQITETFVKPFRSDNNHIQLTPMMCIIRVPEAASYVEDVMEAIHDCMTELHRSGSNQNIIRSGEESLIRRRRESAIRHVLKRALQKDEFQISYQPIYSVREQRFVALEALLRLSEKSLGSISPDEFIPIAEKNGTIIPIGVIVMEHVCAFISENRLWEKGIHHVGVNLSSVQCMSDSLAEHAAAIMDRYHIPCNMITFEVNEQTAIHNAKHLIPNMYRLTSLGTIFCLDQLGSSVHESGTVINFPFRQVKLSKEFIQSSMKDDAHRTRLKHTIAMLRDLNLEVVAVGVETHEQVEELTLYGCYFYQGYYYSKPIPSKDIVSFLEY